MEPSATPSVALIGSLLRVLFVMAATAEYGPQLRARIAPLICGVGPVESAIAVTSALATLSHSNALPDLVVSLGSAGSRTLEHAGVYQVASVCYRDMDASALGFEKGVTPFADHPAVVEIAERIEGIACASLATGGSVVSGNGYNRIESDMVDMECFAVVRAARRYGIATIGLRGISDGRTELLQLEDWSDTLSLIDEKLAAAIDLFDRQVREGRWLR
jgi:adenosylhomocysteine nucleosidase